MTHAYDKILLDRAADSLGRMLDYSVYSLHYDIPVMMDLFIASGVAALFERGDIRTIAGMSGIELSYYCYFTGKSVIKNEIINAFVGLYKGVFIIISRFCRENPNLCLLIY